MLSTAFYQKFRVGVRKFRENDQSGTTGNTPPLHATSHKPTVKNVAAVFGHFVFRFQSVIMGDKKQRTLWLQETRTYGFFDPQTKRGEH